jgi:hypothetical protein
MPFPIVGPTHKGRFTMEKWEKYLVAQAEPELDPEPELVSITR